MKKTNSNTNQIKQKHSNHSATKLLKSVKNSFLNMIQSNKNYHNCFCAKNMHPALSQTENKDFVKKGIDTYFNILKEKSMIPYIVDESKPIISIKKLSKNYNWNLELERKLINKLRDTNSKKTVKSKIHEIKRDNKTLPALSEVNLDIKRGDMIALIGKNGSGKTTLVRIIAGFISKSTGSINFNYTFGSSPTEVMGVSFQKSSFISSLTPMDYIKFVYRASNLSFSSEIIASMIEIFGLKFFLNRKISGLSGGQQQRLNIFLALITMPRILIVDELINNLDAQIKNVVFDFVKRYIKVSNCCGINITHNKEEINAISNRYIMIKDGKTKELKSINDPRLKSLFEEYKK